MLRHYADDATFIITLMLIRHDADAMPCRVR